MLRLETDVKFDLHLKLTSRLLDIFHSILYIRMMKVCRWVSITSPQQQSFTSFHSVTSLHFQHISQDISTVTSNEQRTGLFVAIFIELKKKIENCWRSSTQTYNNIYSITSEHNLFQSNFELVLGCIKYDSDPKNTRSPVRGQLLLQAPYQHIKRVYSQRDTKPKAWRRFYDVYNSYSHKLGVNICKEFYPHG